MKLNTVKSRIDYALKMSDKGRTDLASQMEVSRGAVSDMLNKEGDPPIKYLQATASITGYNFEWLRTGEGPEKEGLLAENIVRESPLSEYGNNKQIIVLKELVESQKETIILLKEEIARLKNEINIRKNKKV